MSPRKTTIINHQLCSVKDSHSILTAHHEDLHRQDDQDVVDMEPRMTVVERQESIDRQLRAHIIVFSTEHLFSHTVSKLGLEVQDGTEPEITAFATLVVLRVFDASATTECVHSSENILVQMQSLLSFRYTTASGHENTRQEIRVTIMQFTTDPCPTTSSECSERLFLASGDVTENTNVLREDILASTDNGNRRFRMLASASNRVRALRGDLIFLKLAENVSDLQTFFEVVILIGIDELEVFATVKDDRMILVIALAISEDRVAG